MYFRKILGFLAVLAGALSLSGAALADAASAKAAVDAAKAQGVVGEQTDGFLGFVKPSSDPAVRAAVNEINAGRAQLYRQAAARNGVTEAAAGAAAFQTVGMTRVQPGEYYQNSAGAWVRK